MGKESIQNWRGGGGLLEIIRIVCMEKTIILQVTGKTEGGFRAFLSPTCKGNYTTIQNVHMCKILVHH